MYELRVLALSEDARYVVLAPVLEGRRERYRVPVDDRLRAALRGELGRLERKVRPDSALTPREIQARVRAGETAETIAAAAGVPVEWVLRFEAPVLAERAMVARQARQSSLSVSGGEWTGVPLEEIVTTRLETARSRREQADEEADWDAWRRDDGRWVLQLRVGTATAHWLWDPALQRLVVHDEAARDLLQASGPLLPGGRAVPEPRHLTLAPDPGSGADREELEPELVVELRSEAEPEPAAPLPGTPTPAADRGHGHRPADQQPPDDVDEYGLTSPADATPSDAGSTPPPAADVADTEPAAARESAAGQPVPPGGGANAAAHAGPAPADTGAPEDAGDGPPVQGTPTGDDPPTGSTHSEPDSAAVALALAAPELAGRGLAPEPTAPELADPEPADPQLADPEPADPAAEPTPAEASQSQPAPGTDPPIVPGGPRGGRRNRRKAVPSWEDILLGTGVGSSSGEARPAPPEAAR